MIELPGYQLIRELGRGGMARVYLALHEGLDRHVAIKLMYPNLSANKAAKRGVNRVAGKYLGLALKKAQNSDFDLADAYVCSAAEISSRHPKLAATQQKISNLKNKQLAQKAAQSGQAVTAGSTGQAEVQEAKTNKIPKQRAFGGF